MNKQRRKLIETNLGLLENIKNNLEGILFEEECCFDNMPENLQSSLRGEESEESIDILSRTIETLDDCIENLNEII